MTWHPVSGSDPLPGDPPEVQRYADELVRTADLIADQVGMLRRLADPSNWVADTADAFREQARDLATDIDKAEGRYRAVGSELSRWADVLDDAQRAARSYRDQARQAQHVLDTTPVPVPSPPATGGPAELTPAEEAQLRRREQAEDDIGRLRGRLEELVADTDQRAWEYARRIRAALDDDVANGWFDRLKAKLSGISDVLKTVAKWAGYVALALGVLALALALVVTAPAWLLAAAAIATGVATIAGIGLALSENGSWWAPAFDALALATFGVGRLARAGATVAIKAARPAVAESRAAVATAASLARNPGALSLAQRLSTGRFVPGLLRTPAGWYLGYRGFLAERAATAARASVQVLPGTTFGQRILHGGSGAAGLRAQAHQFLRESADPVVVSNSLRSLKNLNVATGATVVADIGSLAGSLVKEHGPTTDLGRWKTIVGRILEGFS